MADSVKRTHYFNGQFLRENDFNAEQKYHMERLRDHNRLLHTPGIAKGLDIPPPPASATSITINAGVAYDNQGREIVLADNKPIELKDFADNASVYIVISYREQETDPTSETGVTGNTRITEDANLETLLSAPTNPDEKLIVAKVNREGKTIKSIDTTDRRNAGVVGGDLQVQSLTFGSPNIASSGWSTMRLNTEKRVDFVGSLFVSQNLNVTGTIQGVIATGIVGTNQLADNAVNTAKLADNAVTSAKIADGNVATAELANNAVITAKIADNAVTSAKIADGNVATAELADNAVINAKIANDTINESKLDPATRGKINTAINNFNPTTGHDHDGTNSKKISPTNLSGVNATVTAPNLNTLTAGATSDASTLHFHATIPTQNRRYHVPLAPQKYSAITAGTAQDQPEFSSNLTTMVAAANTKPFGKIPLYLPSGAVLTQISVNTVSTLANFEVDVQLAQVAYGSSNVTTINTVVSNSAGDKAIALNHTVNNETGRYWLLINVATSGAAPISIQGIFIDYQLTKLF
ncbi:MAG TPA: hypothetical protein V6D11_04690 [Waterburya sp.]|jgi:hypothetical protein